MYEAAMTLSSLSSSFFQLCRPPRPPTLFPYTTLFRSLRPRRARVQLGSDRQGSCPRGRFRDQAAGDGLRRNRPRLGYNPRPRSEEHTSELQSHSDLVCRLLLEKKKKKHKCNVPSHKES